MRHKPNILRQILAWGVILCVCSLLLLLVSGAFAAGHFGRFIKDTFCTQEVIALVPWAVFITAGLLLWREDRDLSKIKRGALWGTFGGGIITSICIAGFVIHNYPASFQDGTCHWAGKMLGLYLGSGAVAAGAVLGGIAGKLRG